MRYHARARCKRRTNGVLMHKHCVNGEQLAFTCTNTLQTENKGDNANDDDDDDDDVLLMMMMMMVMVMMVMMMTYDDDDDGDI